ncbi:NAD-binding protein [Lentinula guzmanii]|uniref:NAD-binding protein n=1 Tax=Lentinula guzmanii TaxID=2804957 RepID=A0AA38MUK3_9AGAR|nr:NAD-binding protein [Lentinula guzmanii]
MSRNVVSMFLLGATGYIGGSVLAVLRERFPGLKITALVRSETHFDAIRATGITPIHGSFENQALITEHSARADVVLNAADSDDLNLTLSILRGMKQRYESGKPKGILIHTSGVAVFLDSETTGVFDKNGKLWNDSEEDDIRSITPSMLHGHIDVPILNAGNEGYAHTYIVCPAAVVGPSLGPIGKSSFFVKAVVQMSLVNKRALYVGEGSNEFNIVHIDDVVDLYCRVFELSTEEKGLQSFNPYARYFIATSKSISWREIATFAGASLYKRDILKRPEPLSVNLTDLPPYFAFLAASERIVAVRGKELGWAPRDVSLERWFQANVDAVLEGLHVD